MKRSWNPWVWFGFALTVASIIAYPVFFVRFPVTRDSPWAALLLMAVGIVLLATGIARAFRRPDAYRGKIFGSILGLLTALLVGVFLIAVFYVARQTPASHGAPKVGEVAPDFTLPDSQGHNVSLSSLLSSTFIPDPPVAGAGSGQAAAVALIFYRGYW